MKNRRYSVASAPPKASTHGAARTMRRAKRERDMCRASQPVLKRGGSRSSLRSCGVRASTLSEALPSLPFPSTELMPAVVQEPSAHACTMATLRELRRTLASSAETKATIAERMRLASLHSRIAYLGTKPLSLHMLYTCATYLGISLRMAPELLWIASAALSAQLPAGWREATGADGMPFYFHSGMGYAMHEHPAHCHWRGVAMFLLED